MAAETYRSQDIRRLFKDKFVLVIGSSVMRSIYKDLVRFIQSDKYLTEKDLRTKGEKSWNGDILYEGGIQHNYTHYREVRQYVSEDGNYCVRFYFITRIYNPYYETILEDLKKSPQPDVVIMNSCLWDMSRYGPWWLKKYKTNLDVSLSKIKDILPQHCLFIWTTCTPVGHGARGGVFTKNVMWKRETIRMDVLEGNFFAKQSAIQHGFDVLDLHFYMRRLLNLRAADDIHWNAKAHRKITNLLLLHFCDAMGIPKPRYFKPLPSALQIPRPMVNSFSRPLMNLNMNGCRPTFQSNANYNAMPGKDCNSNDTHDTFDDDGGFCEDFNMFNGLNEVKYRGPENRNPQGNYPAKVDYQMRYGGPVKSMSAPTLAYGPPSSTFGNYNFQARREAMNLNLHIPNQLNYGQGMYPKQYCDIEPTIGMNYQGRNFQNIMPSHLRGGRKKRRRRGRGGFFNPY